MSSVISGEGDPAALINLVQCLRNGQIASDIAIASAALVFYDWFLTSGDELDFLWCRGRFTFARILFILARYPGLACAIVGVFPQTVHQNSITTCLTVVTILSSELILAMRTWAIWGRSRPILVFLTILLLACAVPAIVVVNRDMVTAVAVPSATLDGEEPCSVLESDVKHAWVVPYVGVIVFEIVVLSLTLYRVLKCYRLAPIQRSRLLDILWIDGVIYFAFMFLLGVLNIGLAVQISDTKTRNGCTQLQTILHSVLSTRIVLHTGRALKQDPVETQYPLVRHQPPAQMVVAGGSRVTVGGSLPSGSGIISESDSDVESQRLIKYGT